MGSGETTRQDHKIPIRSNSINGRIIYSIMRMQFLHIFYLYYDYSASRLSEYVIVFFGVSAVRGNEQQEFNCWIIGLL